MPVKRLSRLQAAAVIFAASVLLIISVKGCHRGRPWEFAYGKTAEGNLQITVNQSELGVRNAVIHANIPAPEELVGKTVLIERRSDLSVGQVLFADLTSLPGRIRFRLGAHVIDIMPRGMLIDEKEVGWPSAMQKPIELDAP